MCSYVFVLSQALTHRARGEEGRCAVGRPGGPNHSSRGLSLSQLLEVGWPARRAQSAPAQQRREALQVPCVRRVPHLLVEEALCSHDDQQKINDKQNVCKMLYTTHEFKCTNDS